MKKRGVGKALAKIYKSYLFTVVARDLRRLADVDYRKQFKKAVKGIDLDRVRWLHKVGLTPYRPVKAGIGSGLLFVAGAGLGALAGLALAPMKGEELRKGLKEKAQGMMPHKDLGQTQAPAQA